MDYPHHIGTTRKLRLWLSFVAAFFIFSSSAWASNDYIVPEVCINRAVEIGVFTNDKTPNYTRQTLRRSYTGDLNIDFNKISNVYQGSLVELSKQLDNPASEIFNYIVDCNSDEEKCHGYFIRTKEDDMPEQEKPSSDVYHLKNPFNLKIYCDSAIYTSLAYESFNRINRTMDKIKQNTKVYDAMNFEKLDLLTVSLDELLNKNLQNYKSITWNAKINSAMPDAFDFILRKAASEFFIFSERKSYKKWIKDFYARIAMVKSLKSCCDNRSLLPDYWVASHSMVQSGHDLETDLNDLHSDKYFPPWFAPVYKKTADALDRADIQRWNKKLHDYTLSELPPGTQIQFFNFLAIHPFFYRDLENGDQIGLANPHLTLDRKRKKWILDSELQEYKIKTGYISIRPRPVIDHPVNIVVDPKFKDLVQKDNLSRYNDGDVRFAKFNPKLLIQNFIFDLNFRSNYLSYLQAQREVENNALLKSQRTSKISDFFTGFIPYAFSRMANAVLIREIQRYRQSEMQNHLGNAEDFEEWSESVVCRPTYNLYKKGYIAFNTLKFMKLRGTYCSDNYKTHRYKSYDQLYDQIKSNWIKLEYNPENSKNSPRRFIYNQDYINRINEKANAVNQYCWSHYDPVSYKKTPDKFQSDTNLNNLMTSLYDAAGEEMNGEEIFTSKLQFNPQIATEQCFTKGYVFGAEIYEPYAASLKDAFNTYKGNLNSNTANKAQTEFNRLSYKETFQMPLVEVTKSQMEDIEKKLEQTAWDEFSELYDVVKNPKKQNDFMRDSATYRALAMIDYLRENPSVIYAQYMGKFIQGRNNSEQTKEAIFEYVKTGMFFAGALSELTFLRLTSSTGAAISSGAVNLALIFGSGAISGWQIWRIHKNQQKLDRGVLTKSIDVDAARVLTQINKQKTSYIQTQTLISSFMLAALSGKSIATFKNFTKNFANSEYLFKVSVSVTELDRLALRFGDEVKYFTTPEFKKFFTSKLKENWDEAQEFLRIWNQKPTSIANIIDKAKTTWGKELPAGIPEVAEVLGSTPKPSWLTRNVWKPIMFGFDSIVQSKMFYRLRFGWLRFVIDILGTGKTRPQKFIQSYLFDRLAMEKKITSLLNSTTLMEKNYFAKGTMEDIVKNLEFYELVTIQGSEIKIFVRKYTPEFEKSFEKFVSKYPYLQANSSVRDDLFKSDLSERLMTREDWMTFFKNCNRQISSRADVKNVIDVLDFGLSRYPGIIRQFLVLVNFKSPLGFSMRFSRFMQEAKALWGLWKPQEIINGPLVYRDRFEFVLKNFDRFFDVGQSGEFLESLKTMKLKESFSLRYGIPEIELIEEVEKIMIREPGQVTERLSSVVNPQKRVFQGQLTNDYEKQFWTKKESFGKYFNNLFESTLKQLSKTIKEGDAAGAKVAFADAYFTAFMKTSEKVNLTNICTLPNSTAKDQIFHTYRKFLNYVSASITGVNYGVIYGDRDKDFEWWWRGGFEIASRFIADKLFLTPLYANGKNYSQLTRDIFFYPVAVGAGIVSDGALYQLLVQSPFNQEGKYEAEFAKMIGESDDAQKKVDEIFQKFPDLHKEMKARIQKLFDFLENLQNKNLYPGELTEEDVIKEAVKQGFIESYFLDKSTKIPDKLLPKKSMYQKLLQLNNATMNFQSSEESKEKIINIMADINFQRNTNGFVNPMALDESHGPSWLKFSPETKARMSYNVGFESEIWKYAILKNDVIFEALCYGGTLPRPAPLVLALSAYVVYKGALDYIRFKNRKEETNE